MHSGQQVRPTQEKVRALKPTRKGEKQLDIREYWLTSHETPKTDITDTVPLQYQKANSAIKCQLGSSRKQKLI